YMCRETLISYLVGENEPCETARQQLFPIFENDSATVTLDDLENAFSVERVTKEFFDKNAEKFYQVSDFLENNSDFKIESQAHGFSAEQFTKKLLGQIVFLYFLQKKGWLGVEKNSAWGTGSQNFMRDIFKKSVEAGENFFDDCLEPLFYTALNVDRSRQNDLYPKLNLRIPFLNGGLFEELDNYDWQKNNFQIPNEIFSNKNTKDRDADGILDIFDRYNFTINEDEPTEREVAIDPEMLGKVFENLLDVSDRKSKGAFYTPREIVHYMCRETLISYLVEKSKISEDAIRNFILYGEYFKDADISNFAENNSLQISEEIFCPDKKINRLAELDEFLQDVKVADLAVGSGAFPLGMLNEITKAREVLISYLNLGKSEKILPSLYDLKISTIKNSIFACDIEPSAVDIAKLRLWLSIVIEDGPTADKNNFTPKPLPNLDCNIICGNSLIDEFEGVPLIKRSEILNNTDDGEYQTSIFQGKVDVRIADLIRVQKNLFHESDHARKEEFRKYIRDIYDDIITEQLGKKTALAKKYKLAASQKSLPFILWQLYFPTVFKNNGGFDIIIGNPPYGAKISPADKKIYKKNFLCTKTVTGKQKGSTDTFALFIEKSFNLCNKGGIVNLIVPMSVTSSDSMTALHNLLEKNCRVIKISSYSNRPKQIFDAACIITSIFSLTKTFSPIENLFTSKMNRRDENHTVKNIIEDLKFVDSLKIKMSGRYPKIGTEIQLEILKKMFSFNKKISDFADENGKPFYYRTSGGRYFNVVTDYPTGSSKEKPFFTQKKFTKIIAATLSTNLFWFYLQTYSNGLDLKQFELENFPLFDLKKLSKAEISAIENLYSEYLSDIEKNVSVRTSSADSSYNVTTFKNYKLRNSKNLIDKLDDLIDKLYGLTEEEINYIKNFELEFRISDNEEG
ncbi:MAG: Eco57I restriction-modification methylase domain-containing protein, partial [Selenomonadaceae bacterium]|nr:Eco57I restriction-modification methylase domain-containing protein [Selenomonadaceae bacterium]